LVFTNCAAIGHVSGSTTRQGWVTGIVPVPLLIDGYVIAFSAGYPLRVRFS
jgi:hypothetical protein